MNVEEKIKRLEDFKSNLIEWSKCNDQKRKQEIRTWINQNKKWVRQQVIEAKCFFTVTISPPPAVGGLLMRNVDLFTMIFERIYLQSYIPQIIDMIDQTIGVFNNSLEEALPEEKQAKIEIERQENYAFVAMPIRHEDPELEDRLDAIKEGSTRCGVQAERIDEPETNERITDRILESIDKAEFVIVDLTLSKPNVYYEAGYAQGIGKIPIYVAKAGTQLEFDLKDYPVIFFKNLKQLKDDLEKRIRGLKNKNI